MIKVSGSVGIAKRLFSDFQKADIKEIGLSEELAREIVHEFTAIKDDSRVVLIDYRDIPQAPVLPSNVLCLKMQYGKDYNYGPAVRPFIYFPSSSRYCQDYVELREKYRASYKRLKVWTRLAFTNIRRYYLIRRLRELGYGPECGGFYRRKMPQLPPTWSSPMHFLEMSNRFLGRPWHNSDNDLYAPDRDAIYDYDRYCQATLETNCVLDYAGGGENTHRMIECAAVGVPFIRPELKTMFHNPMIPGKHYVVIRQDFSDLGQAIDSLQDSGFHEYISHNLTDWFDRNILGVRQVYKEISEAFFRQCDIPPRADLSGGVGATCPQQIS